MKALKKYNFPFIIKRRPHKDIECYGFYEIGSDKKGWEYAYVKDWEEIVDRNIDNVAYNISSLEEAKEFIYYYHKQNKNEEV
jgi:hypothetical protein